MAEVLRFLLPDPESPLFSPPFVLISPIASFVPCAVRRDPSFSYGEYAAFCGANRVSGWLLFPPIFNYDSYSSHPSLFFRCIQMGPGGPFPHNPPTIGSRGMTVPFNPF